MINYVDARTAWMDDIVKQAQWQGITQVTPSPAHDRESHSTPVYISIQVYTALQSHIRCAWAPGYSALSAGCKARAMSIVKIRHRHCRMMLPRQGVH